MENFLFLRLFSETFGFAEENLRPDVMLEELDLDPLTVVGFLLQVESTVGARIPDDANPPHTFGELAALMTPLLSASSTGLSRTSAS